MDEVKGTSEPDVVRADEVDGAAVEDARRNAALADELLAVVAGLRAEMLALRVVSERLEKAYFG